jgi:SAM-dependent methyltransferase
MSHNQINMYDVEPHIAELYDEFETQTDDIALLRRLIGESGPLRILEPFCGTGRILIPLALDGHEIVGLDQARGMLDRARTKVADLPLDAQFRIILYEVDVTAADWPRGFDLVLLGGNCFYELATPEEQEGCIISAKASLISGGYVYVDNDHMEGELAKSWRRAGTGRSFPSGTCTDGTHLESTTETIWYDAPKRLVRFRRTTKITLPDGRVAERSYVQQKHPTSTGEVRDWLEKHGFVIEQFFGDRQGNPYTEDLPRAIFWAQKP